jgi:hypothetical protein
VANDEQVVILQKLKARIKTGVQTLETPLAELFKIRNEKIVEIRPFYFDGELFVSVLTQEIGRRNVTVYSVVAGPIESGFLEQADEKYKQPPRDRTPFGRLGHTADISGAVALLAMDESRWISGQHIVVDGAATHF